MELLHEAWPFLAGMLLAPLAILAGRAAHVRSFSLAALFLPSLALGFCGSLLAGELAFGFAYAVVHIAFDTALTYAGAQVAYHVFWKRLLDMKVQEQRQNASTRRPR